MADEDALRKIRAVEEQIEYLQKKLAMAKQVRNFRWVLSQFDCIGSRCLQFTARKITWGNEFLFLCIHSSDVQVLSLFIEVKKKQKIPTPAVTKLMSGVVGKLSCPCGLGEVSGSPSAGGSCNFFLEVFLLAQFIQLMQVHDAVTYLPFKLSSTKKGLI